MARVAGSVAEEATVASAREEVVKEVEQQWRATKIEWVKVLRYKVVSIK